jgi:hypothetical protein
MIIAHHLIFFPMIRWLILQKALRRKPLRISVGHKDQKNTTPSAYSRPRVRPAQFASRTTFAFVYLKVSDFAPKGLRGVGGSFINTVANYSIAVGMALAEAVETEVSGRIRSIKGSCRSIVARHRIRHHHLQKNYPTL